MIIKTRTALQGVRRWWSLDIAGAPRHYADHARKDHHLTEQTHIAPPSDEMAANAQAATTYLKTLAHEGRLMILCHLGSGEKSVSELEALLQMRQAAVSQMLARLREEGLVATRRDGKTIYYSLANEDTRRVIGLLYDIFCSKSDTC